MQIVIALLALSFLVIVHELGHFTVAKLSDIKVQEFSLFMGPKLFSFQKGETTYSFRLIPIGGYVRMEGEEQESNDARAFNKKPVRTRMAVIAAGPVMNLIIAIIIMFGVYFVSGYGTNIIGYIDHDSPAYTAGIREDDRVLNVDGKSVYNYLDFALFSYVSKAEPKNIELLRGNERFTKTIKPAFHPANQYLLGFIPKSINGEYTNQVQKVNPGSPAEKIKLKENDIIIKLDNTQIHNKTELSTYLNNSNGKAVSITVVRDGKSILLGTIKPTLTKSTEYYTTGIAGFTNAKGGVLDVVKQSFLYTYSTARSIYYSFVYLITGRVSLSEMSGPIGIVSTIGDVVQQGPSIGDKLIGLLTITAFISVNLGVFNLIPFPALDGSKIVLLIIEGIRRKALPPEKEAMISMLGLGLLIMLMLFATSNDLIRIFS
jgi:regulator of sigma E protease